MWFAIEKERVQLAPRSCVTTSGRCSSFPHSSIRRCKSERARVEVDKIEAVMAKIIMVA